MPGARHGRRRPTGLGSTGAAQSQQMSDSMPDRKRPNLGFESVSDTACASAGCVHPVGEIVQRVGSAERPDLIGEAG